MADKIEAHRFLVFHIAALTTIRQVVIPNMPKVTAIKVPEIDALLHNICWAIKNLIAKVDDPDFAH